MSHLSVGNEYDVHGENTSQVATLIRRRQKVNVPLLLITVVVVVLFGLSAVLWTRYQKRRMATSLLSRAGELERGGQYVEAARCLQRYLNAVPDDAGTYIRLAAVSDKGLGDSPDFRDTDHVVRLYLRALGVASAIESPPLRKRACELLFEQERFTLAEAQSNALVKDHPNDPDGWRLLALSIYGKSAQRSFVHVETPDRESMFLGHALEQALVFNPVDVKIAGLLAEVYRQYPNLLSPDQRERVRRQAEARLDPADVRLAKKLSELARLSTDEARKVRVAALELERMERLQCTQVADQIFEAMITKAPENALVWAARYDYRDKYDLPGASEDLQRALELAPRDSRLLLAAGQRARRRADSIRGEEREASLRVAHQNLQAILATPEPTWLGSAADHQRHNQSRKEQEAILRQAFIGLGQVAMTLGDPEQAIQWFREGSLGAGADDVRFTLYLADALLMAGRREEAADEMQRATLRIKEKSPTFRPSMRLALHRSCAMVQGKLYLHEGRWIDAIREFKEIVLDNETNEAAGELTFHAFNLMGSAYSHLEQWDLAGTSFQQALEVRSNHAEVLRAAAIAWTKANRPQQVVDLYTQHLPEQNDVHTWLNLAESLLQVQQGLAPPERGWTPFENALSRAREAHSPQDASQVCRVLLLDVEHTLARQVELKTRERDGKVLYQLLGEHGETPWPLRESHLSFLQGLLPGLDVERTCQAILNGPPDRLDRDSGRETVQTLVRKLCLAQLRKVNERVSSEDPLRWRICQLYERLGSSHEADEILGVQDSSKSPSVDALVARVGLLVGRREFDAARELLNAPLVASASEEDRVLLEDARIYLEQQDGSDQSLEVVRGLLETRHHDRPFDTRVAWQLALLSLRQRKPLEAQEWTSTLRRIEGDEGVLSQHVDLLQLLSKIQDDSAVDNSTFGRAHMLARQIVKHRPYWPAGWVLSARLKSHESRWKEAATDFQRAIQFGSTDLSVYHELVAILFRLKKYQDANRYLERIRPVIATSSSLSALAASVSARLGEKQRALDVAQQRVNQSPRDPIAWLWLSRMQWLNDLAADGEASIVKARELAPQDAHIAFAHFTFCVEKGQIDKARKLLDTIAENGSFENPVQRYLVEARGFESLGDELEAGDCYLRSAELAPEDPAIQMQVATFFLTRDARLAEKFLRTVLMLEPNSSRARRNLGSLLLAKGTKQAWDEAQGLLDPNDHSELGQRLRAMVLLRQRSDNLDPSRRILEQLVARNADDTDRFLLANVYLLDSALYAEKEKRLQRLEQARTHFHILAEKKNAQPGHVMRYVDFLLRYQSREEAAPWLPSLRAAKLAASDPEIEGILDYVDFLVDADFKELAREELDLDLDKIRDSEQNLLGRYIDVLLRIGEREKLERPLDALRETRPDAFSTVARHARWLHSLERDSEVPVLIDSFANQWITEQGARSEDAQLASYVARLYTELDNDEAAETWLRKLIKYDPRQYEPWAQHLARHRQWPELMTLVKQTAVEDTSAHPATVLARCLTHASTPQSIQEAADQRLAESLEAHPDDFGLLVAIARLRQRQGQYAAAASFYERALRTSPDHVDALGQLAECLSHQSDARSRAFASVDRALRIAGPRADLLAIKGMIYLRAGRPGAGLDLLKAAAATIHPKPQHQFYYALALTRTQKIDHAQEVWRGIDLERLNDSLCKDELRSLDALKQKLSQP